MTRRILNNNELSLDDSDIDICKLQNEIKNKRKIRSAYFSRRDDYFKECRQDIDKVPHEQRSSFEPYENNQLLTNADRLWIINYIQNRRRERRTLQDYLRKHHEIFTLQFALNLKRNEIDQWDSHLRKEEHALTTAEKHLTEDSSLFDQFLDESNRTANHAALYVEEQLRLKDELVNEIKRLQKILIGYQNEQHQLVDALKQSRRYQQFLFTFAPKEWCDQVLKQRETTHYDNPPIQNVESSTVMASTASELIDTEFSMDSRALTDENYALYFTKPEQLLDVFTDMEEKSLPLVEKSQFTSEILDRIHLNLNNILIDEKRDVEELETKIRLLEDSIKHEIEREASCQDIFLQCQNRKNEPFIEQIKQTIKILYKKYIISDDIGISATHMLQTIENKIQSLLNTVEHVDSSVVIEAEKSREIDIRTIERQEKLRQEKLLNEIKRQKALLRALAPPYMKTDKVIMEGSLPLSRTTNHKKHSVINEKKIEP